MVLLQPLSCMLEAFYRDSYETDGKLYRETFGIPSQKRLKAICRAYHLSKEHRLVH